MKDKSTINKVLLGVIVGAGFWCYGSSVMAANERYTMTETWRADAFRSATVTDAYTARIRPGQNNTIDAICLGPSRWQVSGTLSGSSGRDRTYQETWVATSWAENGGQQEIVPDWTVNFFNRDVCDTLYNNILDVADQSVGLYGMWIGERSTDRSGFNTIYLPKRFTVRSMPRAWHVDGTLRLGNQW